MRRPRQKLTVSTFPFLAVLLCAMGSLILLLLAMDKRAKAVARHKAIEARVVRQVDREEQMAQGNAKALAQAEADRRAEWELQREQLHLTLLEQERELKAHLAGLTGELSKTQQYLEKKQVDYHQLQQRLLQENNRLLKEHKELTQRQTGLSAQDKEETAARRDLQRFTEEVLQLEKTLRDLKELKSRPSEAFSLVPYRGKHGDNRRPVYIECNVSGLIIHPGRTVLDNATLTPMVLRDEVQQRAGNLERESRRDPDALAPPPRNQNAYVLFLIRPDGIENYYQAQAALKGYAIDYGYELVEAQWVFDFANENLAANQPWRQEKSGPRKTLIRTPGGYSAGARPDDYPMPPGSTIRGNPGGSEPGLPGGPSGLASMTPSPGSSQGNRMGDGLGPLAGPPGTSPEISLSPGPGATAIGPSPNKVPGFLAGKGIGSGNPGGSNSNPIRGSGEGSNFPSSGSPTGFGSGLPSLPPGVEMVPNPGMPGGVAGSGSGRPNTQVQVGMEGVGEGSPVAGSVLASVLPPCGLGYGGGDGSRMVTSFSSPRASGFGSGTVMGGTGSSSPGMENSSYPGTQGNGPGSGSGGSNDPAGEGGSTEGTSGPPSILAGVLPPSGLGFGSRGVPGRLTTFAPAATSMANAGPPGENAPQMTGQGTGNPNSGEGPALPGIGSSIRAPGQFARAGSGNYSSGGTPGYSGGEGSNDPSENGGEKLGPQNFGLANSPPSGNGREKSTNPGGQRPVGSNLWLQGTTSSKEAGPGPPPLSRLLANHDYVITLECIAEGVVLYPRNELYPMTPVANQKNVEQVLLKSLQQIISRRQASVRPGEPSYRIFLRLQVQPEGRRAYYWIYPVLESLHVAMIRENVEN